MGQQLVIERLAWHKASDFLMGTMLSGFGIYILGLVLFSVGEASTVSRWPGFLAGLFCIAVGLPFLLRMRVRMEATADGLMLQGSFTRQTIPWSKIAAFRRGRPGGFRSPYMHFGDAIYADLTSGETMLLPMTMARQPYRNQKDLDDRLAKLQGWLTTK